VKIVKRTLLLMGMMVLPLTLTAQKIAFVQVQLVLGEWEEYGEVARQLELDLRKAQLEFQTMTTQLDDLQNEYNAQQAMLSPTGRREKEAEIVDLQKRVQEFQLNQTNEFSRKQQEAEGPLLERFQLAVRKVANDKGYDIIFDSAALLHAEQVFDVTDDVLYELRRGEQSSPDGN